MAIRTEKEIRKKLEEAKFLRKTTSEYTWYHSEALTLEWVLGKEGR